MHECWCGYVHTSTHRNEKRALDPLELQSQLLMVLSLQRHRGELLTGLLYMTFSPCCFIPVYIPGVTPPTVGWICPPHSLINKCPTGLHTAQVYGGIFLTAVPASQMSSAVSVDIKLSSPEALVPSSDLIEHQAGMWYTDKHVDRTSIHRKKKRIK